MRRDGLVQDLLSGKVSLKSKKQRQAIKESTQLDEMGPGRGGVNMAKLLDNETLRQMIKTLKGGAPENKQDSRNFAQMISDLTAELQDRGLKEETLNEAFDKGTKVKVRDKMLDTIGKKYQGKTGTVVGNSGKFIEVKFTNGRTVEFLGADLTALEEATLDEALDSKTMANIEKMDNISLEKTFRHIVKAVGDSKMNPRDHPLNDMVQVLGKEMKERGLKV